MNVLVIGSGGREHAICWKLEQSKNVSIVYAFPGSHAIAQLKKVRVVNGLNLRDFQVGIHTHAIVALSVVFRSDDLKKLFTPKCDACLWHSSYYSH